MPETLEPKVRETLRAYLRDVKSLNNEANKTSRFNALIGELFPGTKAVTEYPRGVEKVIRIDQAAGEKEKRGRADAYYGNAIIEFEKSLSATLEEAKRQLCEYVAGTWQKEGKKSLRPLLAIASDGIRWISYRPVLPDGAEPTPDTVVLDELRDFKVAEDTLGEFWLWLTSLLFRPQQVEATAEQFQFEFGSLSFQFREGMAALKRAWAKVSGGSEAKLAFDTWQRYLTVTYGRLTEDTTAVRDRETAQEISELENLFLRHTYLASIARLLIWAALSQGKNVDNLRQVARDVLSGRYFESKRLANLVDDDFFHWIRGVEAEKSLAPMWERILSHLTEYDLSNIKEDVLKGVYQQLIDPKDRHDLGEYYTPDWLCERIVDDLLPKHGFKAVLDPSCGSGSFLRATIHHFLSHNPEGTENDRLRMILGRVQGIDIHPVAVTISRATYVLALGRLISFARKPINIPVYLADSLFLPREVEQNLYEKLSGFEIQFGEKKEKMIAMPDWLIHSPEVFDDAITACATVAEGHAKSTKDSRKTLDKYLSLHVPDLYKLLEHEAIVDALWSFTEALADLIRQKKNSIWSFIIRNSYRPAMLKAQFDFIIGNPPWLSYRFISDPDYQQEVKRRAVNIYKIAPTSQRLMTQMELGTVFLAHSMATFANTTARLGFVMPRGVLSADQHRNLIERKYSGDAKLKLTGYWDLWDVEPLFNVPACVLFAERSPLRGSPKDKLAVLEWAGRLPGRDVAWNTARKYLTTEQKEGRVIYLGSRPALSTAPGVTHPTEPSKYLRAFKQGATIVPRSIYFVKVTDLGEKVDPDHLYWAETDPEQATEAKPPYDKIKKSGHVEGRFIYSSAVAKHLLPFTLLKPVPVVLPIVVNHGLISVRESKALNDSGFRHFAEWMQDGEKIWDEKREAKADKQNLYERLDYQRELSSQELSHRYLVLFNKSGTNVSASCFDRSRHQIPFVVDYTLYWASFSAEAEADYITAVLNSSIVNLAIKPFQSTGLLGERDVTKKILELPIPTFNHEDGNHNKLAALGNQSRKKADAVVHVGEFPADTSVARQRAFVRTHLESELKEIDKLVVKLLSK
ncbi:MAG TPA: N-6 DNA methylase [Candidatus Sulfotelmatobacter sp.]|nr:N-6 DNA methylase [Candidatus Sulfotelmatobacter sp.]